MTGRMNELHISASISRPAPRPRAARGSRTAASWAPSAAFAAALLVGASAALFAGGCAREERDKAQAAADPVSVSAEDGPVQLTLSVSPAELPFDQRATVTIHAQADASVTLELRSYEELIREAGKQFEFRAVRRERSDAVPTGGKLNWTQLFDLEFFLPGNYELPGAALTYFSTAAAPPQATDAQTAPAEAKSLATEPLQIKAVETAVAQIPPEELKNIKTLPPVELTEAWRRWWIAAPLAAMLLLAALLVVRRSRTRDATVEPPVPADVWARRQLAELIADDLLARRLAQEFHYRISDILRGYIERRFGVHAREMTTEEFLSAASRDPRLAAQVAADLNRFLTECDLVKYARFETDATHGESLLQIVSAFVERTRPHPEENDGVASGMPAQEKEQAA